jgi:hypothetical protein
MSEPEPERGHVLVGQSSGLLHLLRFTRQPDGSVLCRGAALSAGLVESNTCVVAADLADDLLRDYRRQGYVELADALRRGLLSKDEADSLLG